MLRRVALVRTDVWEEPSTSFIRVTRIGELRTTLAAILVTLMKEALGSSETSVLLEPHGVTSQKTPFFIVTAVKTSNLKFHSLFASPQFFNAHFPVASLGLILLPGAHMAFVI
jgi:hypothetical protein